MTPRQLLHLLQYGAYRAVSAVVNHLPQRVVRRLGRGCGRLAFLLLGRRRRLTLDNLAQAFPERDPAARRRLARDCFAWQGALQFEQVWALGRADVEERFEIVGREHLERAQALGKGLFILASHYGCWEIAAAPLGRLLGKLHVVARRQSNPHFAAEFERLRERTGSVQIDRSRAGVRMLKVLKRGGAVGVLVDQRVRPSQALLVPFLGRLAWTSRLPAYLSTVTGCVAVPMVCVPLPDGRYRMTLDAPILPEGEGDDEVERLTLRYNQALEPYVRERPELWLWMHTRWQRTARHRQPESVARLVREAGLPPAPPLRAVARQSAARSPARALERLVDDRFLEDCRHLLLLDEHASSAAASLGDAVARRGHPTRYLAVDDLVERLARSLAESAMGSALRELDQASLVVVDRADPRRLPPPSLELLGRFLEHRRARGSVVLAGAGAEVWRAAADRMASGAAVRELVDACAIVEIAAADASAFDAPAKTSERERADAGAQASVDAAAHLQVDRWRR
jgi:KDO2-lipid IV(A) lauroyltransferase